MLAPWPIGDKRTCQSDLCNNAALNTSLGVRMRLQEVFDLWVTEKKNRQQYAKIAVLKSTKVEASKHFPI